VFSPQLNLVLSLSCYKLGCHYFPTLAEYFMYSHLPYFLYIAAVGQGFQTPQRQIYRPNFQSPRSAPPPLQRNKNAQNSGVVGPCYICGQSGHYANRCIRKQANQTPAQAQIRMSTAEPTTVHQLRQGRIKLMLM
jgi:hypothetical protein